MWFYDEGDKSFTLGAYTVSLKLDAAKCWAAKCGKELTKELDAYYGKDPMGEHYCTPCRRKLGVK